MHFSILITLLIAAMVTETMYYVKSGHTELAEVLFQID